MKLRKLHLLLAVFISVFFIELLSGCMANGAMYDDGEWDMIEYGSDSDVLLNLGELELDDMDR